MTLRDSLRRSSYTLVPPISFSRPRRSVSLISAMNLICRAQGYHVGCYRAGMRMGMGSV